MCAASSGNSAIVRSLLDAGARVNETNERGAAWFLPGIVVVVCGTSMDENINQLIK